MICVLSPSMSKNMLNVRKYLENVLSGIKKSIDSLALTEPECEEMMSQNKNNGANELLYAVEKPNREVDNFLEQF